MSPDSPQVPPPLPASADPPARNAQTEGPRASTIEQAARASWLAPLVALALLVLTWKMPRGAGSVVIAVINSVLLLAGLCLGVVALAALRERRSKKVDVQAGVGVGLSVLLLVVVVWSTFFTESSKRSVATTGPTTSSVASAGPPRATDPILDFPGWVGSATEARAAFLLVSVPDDSPATREFKAKFAKDFAVLMLSIDTSQAPYDVYVDTTRASAHFADGQTVAALPIKDILESAITDKQALLAEWMPPRQCRARAGSITNMMIPLPPSTYLKNMDRVSITVNGLPVDVRGMYLTVEEKAQRMRRPEAPTQQPPTQPK